jgi:hypothetical protein
VLLAQDGFALDRRACYKCARVDDFIVPAEDAR